MEYILQCKSLTKLYGAVIGVNDLCFDLEPGVHGLLGPNGAGKSTLLKLITGQLRPSQGQVRVLGEDPWNNPGVLRRIGYCPEHDAFWLFQTGLEFVTTLAQLSGMSRREALPAAKIALSRVGAEPFWDRPISTYSKGMRQRTKLAQAIVHNPDILILDEPLSGTDPVGRREIMDLVAALGADGTSVIVSSHVMHEVQAMTNRFLLVFGGRVLAAGDVQEIRALLYEIPHRIRIVCSRPRELARELAHRTTVDGVEFEPANEVLWVTTRDPREVYQSLPACAKATGAAIREMGSEDESLDAVFEYLVGGGI